MLNAMLRDKRIWAAFSISFSSVCLLTGYDMVRSPSNTLFKAAYGAEGLTWVLAGAPFALLGFLYLYGRALSRLQPRRTLHLTMLVSGIAILVSYALIRNQISFGTVLLILVREAYAVLIIEQYWSFLNSTLTEPQARRINGPVTGISSLGGALGGFLVAQYGKQVLPENWLLWGTLSFLPAMLFAELGYRLAGEPRAGETPAGIPPSDEGLAGHASHERTLESSQALQVRLAPKSFSDAIGLPLFKTHPLLLLLFGVILCTQIAATSLDIHFQTLLQTQFPNAAEQTAYSGRIFMWLNMASFGIQFLIAPLLLRFLSLGTLQALIPCINLIAILYCWNFPTLGSAVATFLIFKSMDYSIFRASKEILYIPFSFDVRFRAKEVIDAFGYRFGKGGASFAFFLLKSGGVALAPVYVPVALAASSLWLLLISVLFMNRKATSK